MGWRLMTVWGGVLVLLAMGLGFVRTTQPRPYRVLYATPSGLFQVYVDNSDWALLASHSLIDVQSPVVSPDGQWIAYSRSSACAVSLYLLSVDGLTNTFLHRFGEDAPCNNGQSAVALRALQWSPDSRWLLMTYAPLTVVQGLDNSQQGVARLYRVSVDEQRRIQALSDDDSDALSATYSPDGESVAYIQQIPQGRRVVRVSVAGGDPLILTSAIGAYEEPLWSPDGAWVYYRARNGSNWDIYRVSSDGLLNQRLTDSPSFEGMMDWSPDGERLVFVSDRDGDRELFTMHPDGTHVTQLTFNTVEDARPKWSPSGNWIAFVSYRASQRGIYVIQPDGRHERYLQSTDFSQDWYPTWIPMPEQPSHARRLVLLGGVLLVVAWILHRFRV